MKQTIYKVFIATQYEKEEDWLNEMSEKGLALVHAGFFKYIFEDSAPGEYIYKIQLLDSLHWNRKSTSYLQFLEETGVEHVASIFRWVYLRKKSEDGPFSLYSDVGSTIKYLQRLQLFFISLMICEYIFGIQNILIGTVTYNELRFINILLGIFLLFLGVLLTIAAWEHTKKIRLLRRESQVRE